MNLQEINSIVSKINNKVYNPIYFLMGEETYYIDLIVVVSFWWNDWK